MLVFDTMSSGHHMEYLHHLHEGMQERNDDSLLMVVPPSFKESMGIYQWGNYPNVRISYLNENEMERINHGGVIKRMYSRSVVLNKYVRKYNPDLVFLITFMSVFPFFLFFLPKETKVSGIVYKISVYRWNECSFIRKSIDYLTYKTIAISHRIANVFILNDNSAVCYLNRRFNTGKYLFLTDPFNMISYKGKDIRAELDIDDNTIFYLHFGGMTDRKGTLEILEAIEMIPEDRLNNKVFVFAGKIKSDIKNDFYNHLSLLEGKCRILVFDEFCKNELLVDLCVSSNVIMMPYKDNNLSSGVLGYAAEFSKPVIGPRKGLIGKLIKRYGLGITINDINAESIYRAICINPNDFVTKRSKEYRERISIGSFCSEIFNMFVFCKR